MYHMQMNNVSPLNQQNSDKPEDMLKIPTQTQGKQSSANKACERIQYSQPGQRVSCVTEHSSYITDWACEDPQPIQASGALPGLIKRNKRARHKVRHIGSASLSQWSHQIRAYSYPDLGIVGSSHCAMILATKLIGYEWNKWWNRKRSIQECCLVLVLPSLEVAHRPTSWCVSAGIEQNSM